MNTVICTDCQVCGVDREATGCCKCTDNGLAIRLVIAVVMLPGRTFFRINDQSRPKCPMVGLSYPAQPCTFDENHDGACSFTLGL